MIKKEVKRFVELIKSNPDDFIVDRYYGDYPYDLVFRHKRHEDNSELLETRNKEKEDDTLNILYPHFRLTFRNTNWVFGFFLFGRETQYNLNIVERLFLKRNLEIHLNADGLKYHYSPDLSLLFSPYKAKLLALKNNFFLLLKNILNIKKHAWVLSIVLQLLTIGLVLYMGVKS